MSVRRRGVATARARAPARPVGVEGAYEPLTLGLWFVELAEPHGHVAADDRRAPAALDDDDLCAAGVAGGRDEPNSRQQLELTVDGDVLQIGCVDPVADRVVLLVPGVLELLALHVDRRAGEEDVAAAVVEVQMGVDHDVDAGEVELLRAQGTQAGIEVGHERVQLGHARVDQHARLGVVDDVHVDRHPPALDEQVGDEDRGDGDASFVIHQGSPCIALSGVGSGASDVPRPGSVRRDTPCRRSAGVSFPHSTRRGQGSRSGPRRRARRCGPPPASSWAVTMATASSTTTTIRVRSGLRVASDAPGPPQVARP